MYIALLFSGHKRSFMKHAGRWRELIDALEADGAIVNCFFHSWTVDCQVEQRGRQRIEGSYVKVPLEGKQEMIDALPFKNYCFEDEEKAEAQLVLPERAFLLDKQAAKKHIGMQLYSMQRSYEQMIQWEKENDIEHSTIVKLRFDIEPKRWDKREFFLSEDPRFARLLIASNEAVHKHPGGGGGCLACCEQHRKWWEQGWRDKRSEGPEPEDELWQHEGAHGNDICDLYAIGNRLTMERYMTVYSRATKLYSPELFESTFNFVKTILKKPFSACSVDDRDLRLALRNKDMEDHRLACFYPERLQRLNLEGFSVLHAASMFYRD
jgi:hypothetical protein